MTDGHEPPIEGNSDMCDTVLKASGVQGVNLGAPINDRSVVGAGGKFQKKCARYALGYSRAEPGGAARILRECRTAGNHSRCGIVHSRGLG